MKPTTIVHKNIFVVMMISEVKCRPGLFFLLVFKARARLVDTIIHYRYLYHIVWKQHILNTVYLTQLMQKNNNDILLDVSAIFRFPELRWLIAISVYMLANMIRSLGLNSLCLDAQLKSTRGYIMNIVYTSVLQVIMSAYHKTTVQL